MLNAIGFSNEEREAAAKRVLAIATQQRMEEEAFLERIESGNGIIDEREKNRLKTLGEQHQALSTIIAAVEKQKGKVDEVTLANEHLNEIFIKNEELFAGMGVDIDQIREALKDFNKVQEETATFSEHMTQAIGNSAATFTKEFTDALLNGENALDSFNDFAKNIVSQIISTFLQLAVVSKILNSIFGSGPNEGPFDVLSGGKIIKGEVAGGGTVQRGAPTLVGERGPEIFVPNTGGTVMNNMNSKNAMGGGSPVIVNQSINFATGVVPTVRAEVQKMLPQISDVTKGAVLEAAVRGGSFRKGLQGRG